MNEDFIKRIDDLANSDLWGDRSAEISALIARIAVDESTLRSLVERYLESKSKSVIRSLAFLFARFCQVPGKISGSEFIYMIRGLGRSDDPETLISCLDATSVFSARFSEPIQGVDVFLNSCLGFRGRLETLVLNTTLEVIDDLLSRKQLSLLFSSNEISRLRERLRIILQSEDISGVLVPVELKRL